MAQESLTDAELSAELEGESSESAIIKAEPHKPITAAEALKGSLGPLAEKAHSSEALAAKNLTDVLPLEFYDGAAELQLTKEQEEKIEELSKPSDEDINIRPDGFIYVGHDFYRRVLTAVFGRGGWAEVEASPVELKRQGDAEWIYQRWALYVRGYNGRRVFIRSCLGSARWFRDNPRANFAETLESVRSDALPRNAAKGSLQIALEPWMKKVGADWKKKYAIQVFVKDRTGRQDMMWRRADGEPLIGEIGPVDKKRAESKPEAPKNPPIAPPPEATQPPPAVVEAKPIPEAQPAPAEPPKAAKPRPKAPEAPKPEKIVDAPTKTNGDMVQDMQIRLFFAMCRKPKCKLIEGENAGGAVAWLADQLGWSADRVRPMAEGKKTSEVVVKMLRSVPMSDWRDKILPNLRNQYGI